MFTFEQASAYLAAMIDGEGTVSEPVPGKYNREISIGNTDEDIIAAIKEAFDVLDIGYRVYLRQPPGNRKPLWNVIVHGRPNMKRIRDNIPIRAMVKLGRLDRVIASYSSPTPLNIETITLL